MTWVVYLTFDVNANEDQLVEYGEFLEGHDGSVANIPGRGVLVTLWVSAPEPLKAAAWASEFASALVGNQPVGIEVVTEAEHERRAEEPSLPDLVSAPEVGQILGGLSRQRVYQLQSVHGFPEPLYRLRTGPVWDRRAIDTFAREWDRKPGRPSMTTTATVAAVKKRSTKALRDIQRTERIRQRERADS